MRPYRNISACFRTITNMTLIVNTNLAFRLHRTDFFASSEVADGFAVAIPFVSIAAASPKEILHL